MLSINYTITLLSIFVLLWNQVHSFCAIEAGLQSGNVSLNNSLRGVTLNVAMTTSGLPWSVYDAETNTFTAGYMVDIVNRLSQIAGFTVNYSAFILQDDEPGWTQGLQRVLKYSDFAGDWFTDATHRRALDMNYAHHFIDATTVLLIQKPGIKQKVFSVTAFLKPFTTELWLWLIFGIVFNATCGFLFYIMEHPKAQVKCQKCCVWKNAKDLLYEFGSYQFDSFSHFTGAGDRWQPKSVFSRINTILWAFLVVIVLASYTANLATFLINAGGIEDSLDTIDAIVAAGKPVCISRADIATAKVKARWSNIKFVYGTSATYAALVRNGSCVGALTSHTAASVILRKNCDMKLTTERIIPSGGSFVFQTDENRCGPAILRAVDFFFVLLEENGELDELWEKTMQLFQCEFDVEEGSNDNDSGQLGVYDLGGMGMIYSICAVVLLGLYAIYMVIMRGRRKQAMEANETKSNVSDLIEVQMQTVQSDDEATNQTKTE